MLGASSSRRAFYLTTPIYYVNATPHLGHAYTTLVADAMARYHRWAGDEVFLLTGTDEHGDKIAQAAARAGETPHAYTDRIAATFRTQWDALRISYDDFIRTTEPRHKAVVQIVLQRLYDAGEIYFGEYGGLYCYGCERFYLEKELAQGRCPQHDTTPTFLKEPNYFFRLSRYQDWLVQHIETNGDFIRPERYRNEVLAFLREPLQDLSISRPKVRLEWGIPLPFDENFVTYVWFDALLNYVSALGWPDSPRFATFWPHAQHLIAKDILRPHAVYWPPMLRAAGIPVYQRLNVHGYWTLAGGKISKSVGNVVEALKLAETYGRDAFRYFVLREMTFGLDATFSEEALVARLNADLANDLGNLVSRAMAMLTTFSGGAVPVPGPAGPAEEEVQKGLVRASEVVQAAMEEFGSQRALSAIWEWIGALNRYIDAQAPWALAKGPAEAERLRTVLYTLAEALRALAVLLDPFLPDSAGALGRQLGLAGPHRLADLSPWGRTVPGTRVTKLPALFPRVDAARAPRAARRGDQTPTAPAPAGVVPRVSHEEFGRLDLRVAEILDAEPIPKSKRLLKLTVKLADETRTVVAGIAEHYLPDTLRGRKVVLVTNLEPATLMGVQSNGMLLAGSDGGMLALLTLDRDLPPGTKVS